MIEHKLEIQADSDNSAASKEGSMEMATTDSLQDQHSSSSTGIEGTEPKKMKKLRSIKLSRIPSWKQQTRRPKSRSDHHQIVSSGNMGTPFMPYQTDEFTASPNYMKPTSCSDARKENLQASASNSESSSDYDSSRPNSAPAGFKSTRFLEESISCLIPTKILSRSSSLKYKKPIVKKKVKKSKRTSNTSTSSSPSATRMSDTPRLYSKAVSDQKKVRLSRGDERRKNLNNSKVKSTSPALKSGKVLTKTTSLRPVRILTKMASLRSKKPSMIKCSEVSQIPYSCVDKATCSSTFKNSKFPKHVELQPEGFESEGISAMKVCPYTYCSLHGHHHGPAIPLKRFVSARRRLLRSQKSMKPKIRPSLKAKISGDAKQVIGGNKMATVRDAAISPETDDANTTISPETGNSSIFNVVKSLLSKPEANGFCDNVSLKPDDAVSTCSEEVPVDVGEVHEGTISSLHSKYWHGDTDSMRKNSNAPDLATMTGDPLNRSTSSSSDDLVESSEVNSNVSSAFVRDRFNDLLLRGLPPLGASARKRTTDLAAETRMEKDKYISMWHLIHHSMSSGKVSPQLRPDGGVDDVNTSLQENNFGQGIGIENLDAGNQKIELDAIKLVEEAIDEILLPEIEDQSSDARSTMSDINSDEDLQEKNHREDGEGSMPTSTNSAKDSLREFDKMKVGNGMIGDREEALLEADDISTSEQKKTVQKVGSKSNQPMPKNWSKLKKFIVFKRFIKALDKVRNLNFREPQYLPLEPDPGAERVNLRRQTAEERKRAEEWMLDYALRQVVGNLTPTRRRKVELLVEAFETVIPVSGNETGLRLKAAVPPRTNPSQDEVRQGKTPSPKTALLVSPVLNETSLECCRIESDLEKHNAQATDTAGKEDRIDASKLDNGEENFIITDNQPGSVHCHSPELGVPTLYEESLLKPDIIFSTSPEEVPVPGKLFEEVSEEIISSSKTDSSDGDNGSNGENLTNHDSTMIVGHSTSTTVSQNIDDLQDSTATKIAVSSASVCDLLNVQAAVSKESTRDSEQFNQGPPRPEDTEPECETHEAYKAQLDKQKYMKMWRVIYQQVVSGSAENFGSHQHLDIDKGEQVDDANTPDGAKFSSSLRGLSETDDNVGVKHHTVHQKVNFSQIEAIKLVEKAIDEIVLPEIEEQSSDAQSNTSEVISDTDLLEKNEGEGGKLSISTSNNSADNHLREFGQIKPEYGVVRDAGEIALPEIEEQSSDDQSNTSEIISYKDLFEKNDGEGGKLSISTSNNSADNNLREFGQIKPEYGVVRDAGEIALPEIEEQSSDDQSNTSEKISDTGLFEKNDGEGGKLSISTSKISADNNLRELGLIKPECGVVRDAGEKLLKDDVKDAEQEKMKLKIGSKSNWSNLKKLILLNRFVKALEKVRELNPREPRSLSLEPDTEPENINLRHQTMEEKKGADDWMVDNAIQQVVARLTPARKRRVELLVQAFETVTPLADIGTTQKHNTGQRFWPKRSLR